MTRLDQKLSERQTLDAVLAALGIRPDQEPVEGEAPDFTMLLSGRTVGVEITMYRSGATVDGGKERRPVESEWDLLCAASEQFRSERPDLRDINVGLMFSGQVPPRRQHLAFMEEIAAFIRNRVSELTSEDTSYWPPHFSTPLMRGVWSGAVRMAWDSTDGLGLPVKSTAARRTTLEFSRATERPCATSTGS